MYVFDLVGSENHLVYQQLAIENLDRQYGFLRSVVESALALKRPILSLALIRALNYHAISCLHTNAGEFRPCPVTVGTYVPPDAFRVPALMEMFVDEVNRVFETADPIALSAFVLWKLNHIHPFINGNGRTARVTCYYVLCLKAGAWLPGTTILPELIRAERPAYVAALKAADASAIAGALDLSQLHAYLSDLIARQLAEVGDADGASETPEANEPS